MRTRRPPRSAADVFEVRRELEIASVIDGGRMREETFVLVHGGWQTAATWELIRSRLEAVGHRVIVPRLTGLENEIGEPTPEVNLETHIEDVARVLGSSDVANAVLVG